MITLFLPREAMMPSGRPRKVTGGSETTRRGYDGEHKKARARALRELRDGEPCPFCGRGMFVGQDLDFDHEVPVVLGGKDGPKRLSHASCNRAAGARLRNRMRRDGERPARPSVPVRTPRPRSGTLCYRCGRPMLDGQALESGLAMLGDAWVWWHGRCPASDYSVPLDSL